MQDQDRRRCFAAGPRELLRKNLDEACQADGMLVEERHDAQSQTLFHLDQHAKHGPLFGQLAAFAMGPDPCLVYV